MPLVLGFPGIAIGMHLRIVGFVALGQVDSTCCSLDLLYGFSQMLIVLPAIHCLIGCDTGTTVGHHIGTLVDALQRRGKRVQPGLNWRCGALQQGWPLASETTLGAYRFCADLMRKANEKRTDL